MILLNNLLIMFLFTMFATTSSMNAINAVPNASEIVLEDNTTEDSLSQPETDETAFENYTTVTKEKTAASTLNNKSGL